MSDQEYEDTKTYILLVIILILLAIVISYQLNMNLFNMNRFFFGKSNTIDIYKIHSIVD